MSKRWTKQEIQFAELAGVKMGPEKFGLPIDTEPEYVTDDPKNNPLICIACDQPWSCHRGWECPDQNHIDEAGCIGQEFMKRMGRYRGRVCRERPA